MKKLLFVTAMAAVCCTQLFAGSSCSTCPTAPQKDTTAPAEEKTEAEKTKENPTLNLLAANSSSMDSSTDSSSGSTMNSDSSSGSQSSSQDSSNSQSSSQMQSKMLLAGGNQPTTTPAPEGTTDNMTQEQKDAQKQQPPQLLA